MADRLSDLGRVTWGDEQNSGSVKKPLPFYARPHDTPSSVPPHLAQTSVSSKNFLTRRQRVIMTALGVCLGACLFVAGFFVGSWYDRQHSPVHSKSKSVVASAQKPKDEATSKKQYTPDAPKPLYSVELGALLSRLNAEELARYLQKENISAKIITQQRQAAPPIFIVRTQEYPSYIEARTVAEMLINKHLLSATVVKSDGSKTP
jgi:hypothetical protein